MTEHIQSPDQPRPPEAFGHPVTKLVRSFREQSAREDEFNTFTTHNVSNHSPGFEESLPPAYSDQATGSQVFPAELPPRDPDKVPRTGLAERISQHLSQQEGTK